uniref:Uncharacterized protein n=1 Tax=Magallana gigas TaxID=29159 RepID=K1PSW0_MAGGI
MVVVAAEHLCVVIPAGVLAFLAKCAAIPACVNESHDDNLNPIQGEVEGIDFREDCSYIIITNESCSPSKTYKIRTQALEEIFPGSKCQEKIHVQGTAHGMTIIELHKINPAKKSKMV